jgi:hypothetical protein
VTIGKTIWKGVFNFTCGGFATGAPVSKMNDSGFEVSSRLLVLN